MAAPALKIGIAGAGGIGSHLISWLYNYGVQREQFPFVDYQIDVYDDDTVDLKNLLHQNFTEDELGKLKVKCMADRYAVNPIAKFMTVADLDKYDIIFSCVDSMEFRKSLYEWFFAKKDRKTFFIDGRSESTNGILLNSTIPQKRLMDLVNDDKVRAGCLTKHEKENNISQIMPVMVATGMVQLFLNHLRGKKNMMEQLILL